MSFERALQENPAPRSLGDVSLQYEAPVLVGEARRAGRRSRALPEMVLVLAFGCGLGAVAALLSDPGGGVGLPAALGLLAGAGVGIAARLERRIRQRRRFVLHFGDETLRLELPGGLRHRGLRRVIPFDDVREVYVLERADGSYALAVDFVSPQAPERAQAAVLVDEVRAEEAAELQRLWTTLRAAFGIRRPPPAARG